MSAAVRTLLSARRVFLSMVFVSSAMAASYCLLTRAAVSAATRSAVSWATCWIIAAVPSAWAPTSTARPVGDLRTGAGAGAGGAVRVGVVRLAVVLFAGLFFAAVFFAAVFLAGAFFAVDALGAFVAAVDFFAAVRLAGAFFAGAFFAVVCVAGV